MYTVVWKKSVVVVCAVTKERDQQLGIVGFSSKYIVCGFWRGANPFKQGICNLQVDAT